MLMTSWQATTFLIGEYFSETDANPVFTVADGLIWLRQSVERNSMVRKMQILKMRGQPTLPGLHTFRINQTGLEVFPPAVVPSCVLPLKLIVVFVPATAAGNGLTVTVTLFVFVHPVAVTVSTTV